MFRTMKAAVAAAAAAGALALGGASTAGAVNVGTQATPLGSGTMPVDAAAGASRLVVGSLAINCANTGANGSASTGAFTLPATVFTLQADFTSCTGPLGIAFDALCTSTSSVALTSLTGIPGPVAMSSWSIWSCVYTITGIGCTATLTGSVNGDYANPSGATAGILKISTAGQSLTISGSTCSPALLPNGPAQLGAPVGSGTGITDLSYTLSGSGVDHPFVS